MNALEVWLIVLPLKVTTLSLITLMVYAWDKRQAGRSNWRVPENRLHLLSLCGGWPGAWVARRWLRHKSIKKRFRILFWLTVMGHIAICVALTLAIQKMSAPR